MNEHMSDTHTLFSTLTQLYNSHTALVENDPESAKAESRARLDAERNLAVQEAVQDLLANDEAREAFANLATSSAGEGRMVFSLRTWDRNSSPRYRGRYLLDLLNKSDLLQQLQDYLDTHYQTPSNRFRIFNHKAKQAHSTFRLTVSWDASGFSNIDDILRSNEEMTQRHQQERDDRRQNASSGGDRYEHRGPHRDAAPRSDRRHDDRPRRTSPTPSGDTTPRRNMGDRSYDNRPPRRNMSDRSYDSRPPRPNGTNRNVTRNASQYD